MVRNKCSILLLSMIGIAAFRGLSAQEYPDLKGSISRMSKLAYTEAFPNADRIELYLFGKKSTTDSDTSEPPERFGIGLMVGSGYGGPLQQANKSDKPIEIDVRSHITITGKQCTEITEAWRSLSFQPNGTFCHTPPYGVRFYKDDKLLLETTVCFRCNNFYMPEMKPDSGEVDLLLYGFKEDSASRKLFRILGRHLPIPKPTSKKK